MAIVNTNPIVNGLSGMLGRTIVFKNLRGKTILTSCPRSPKKQSDQQRANRSKFRQASGWAKSVLLDPVKNEYYQKKARKLKLPNAYTAAIADYMRPAKVQQIENGRDTVTYRVSKKDFDVKNIEINIGNEAGEVSERRVVVKDDMSEWIFSLKSEELRWNVYVIVTNQAGKVSSIILKT